MVSCFVLILFNCAIVWLLFKDPNTIVDDLACGGGTGVVAVELEVVEVVVEVVEVVVEDAVAAAGLVITVATISGFLITPKAISIFTLYTLQSWIAFSKSTEAL